MLTRICLAALIAALSNGPHLVIAKQISFQVPQGGQSPCQLVNYSRKITVAGSITREQAVLRFRRSNPASCLLPIEDARFRALSEMSVIHGEGKRAEDAWKRTLEVTSKGFDTKS